MGKRWVSSLAIAAMLTGCGGGDGSSGTPISSTPTPTATSSPTPTASVGCTLRERQDRVFAQLREWYLFPETLPASLDPAPYTTVQAYLDALTATARNQRRDRFFTFITSIAEENAFTNSGATAGFGVRLAFDPSNRLFITEAFEGAPALAQGIDRGTEIVAIGTSEGNLRTVSSIIAADGSAGVSNALGPNTPGTARVLRVQDAAGTRTVTVTKADFSLTPVSSRYGAKIINDAGRQVGYVNLRTFSIDSADPALRQAFAQFRSAGITNVIIDFRYNGGGLVRIADLMSDLLGRARSTSDVVDYTVFRPEKSSENSTRFFRTVPESIAPTKIAFIGTRASASASELVISAQLPYLRANAALIGTNTFGKPVGQIGLDTAACDDRLRVVAFQTQNAARQGDYYDGLAPLMESSCQAADDISRPLGDPQEASVRAALNFIAGVSCTRIAGGDEVGAQSVGASARRELLAPAQPSAAQRETPGLF
ncbi:S41 family peptidase [Sphingomonas sp.]|uniref:S41 family peptidase n=1 Tax=Sphingomonas sp. TaxID=28214 RepID=UPI002D7E28D3|nr:S41 family peptidase [Sphingomonas sp.]HEU0045378.1 S41 family peptidase [Sphingomonas sp.]